jgi:hypothetical protein
LAFNHGDMIESRANDRGHRHDRDAGGSGALIFAREDFDRRWPDGGNKSTVEHGSDERRVAIFAVLSTRVRGGTMLASCALLRETIVSAGAEGSRDMRHLRSLLRSAPSRIGRRLALIVAIAAASLPSAGA